LETRNDGAQPLLFEEALHTYFAIGDIRQVSVSALQGATYIDKTDEFKRKPQGDEPISFSRETDRLYVDTAATCVVHDPALGRSIVVEKSGSSSTVVWNPWIEKTKSLSDMAADDWMQMICIETANAADNAIRLTRGASHTLTARIRVE
jgi:glucose-6-phosphate 1-epimerase